MNIATVLQQRAAERGDAPAIVEPGRSATFAELDRIAARVAADLESSGFHAGDRALVVCPMSIGLYAVLIGLWRVGGVAMIVDPAGGRDYVDRCCRRSPPRAFIGVGRAHLLRLICPTLRRLPIALSMERWVPGARTLRLDGSGPPRANVHPADADTAALITFTSGSTGQPKAVVRTHGFLLAQHRVLADDLRLRPGQRDLSTLPVFVLANLASGVTSVIPDADLRNPGAIAPVPVLRQLRELTVTRVAASPALLDRLARHTIALREYTSPLEEIYTGGAPVFPGALRRLHQMAPDARITAVYGSTEAEPIAKIAWHEMGPEDFRAMQAGAGLLAGAPVAAIDLRIVADRWGEPLTSMTREAFAASVLQANQVGEIVVSGEHVVAGYLGGVGNAETKIRVGDRAWHRTGDAGYLDVRGRLWLMGRCSAKVGSGAETLYPFAVECAALAIDDVERCALVEHKGSRLLVVKLGLAAPDATRRLILSKLAWARLQDLLVVDELPLDRRHNAKIDYPALTRMLDSLRS